MRLSLGVVAAMVGMAFSAGSAPARTTLPDQKAALAGIQRAVAKGWIERADAARYRGTVNRAAQLVRGLPQARRVPLAANLHQVAQVASELTKARATAVMGQLAVNNAYFARNGVPARKTDITDADGVVYRYMSGLGFEFHPLANFGALNAQVAAGALESTQRLAQALLERGVNEPGGGLGWEYYFDYSGGRAPWLSGMAQAVAAQAFSRAAVLVESDSGSLTATAKAAFRTIPAQLIMRRSSGPWIRLYGFNRLVVLNAQLQSAISLRDYAEAAVDGRAATLAAAMEQAVATDLHRFDTGYWTYYSLPGTPSTLDYQTYVVQLLRKLNSTDSRLASAAARLAGYAKQPPAFKIASGGPGTVRFWLSKPVDGRAEIGGRADAAADAIRRLVRARLEAPRSRRRLFRARQRTRLGREQRFLHRPSGRARHPGGRLVGKGLERVADEIDPGCRRGRRCLAGEHDAVCKFAGPGLLPRRCRTRQLRSGPPCFERRPQQRAPRRELDRRDDSRCGHDQRPERRSGCDAPDCRAGGRVATNRRRGPWRAGCLRELARRAGSDH